MNPVSLRSQEEQLTVQANVDVARWQRKLLPFITRFIAGLAVLCFGLSVFDMVQASGFLKPDHGTDIRNQLQQHMLKNAGLPLTPDQIADQAVVLLEADALDKRYHQAGALLMSRIFTKHLAFITGMVMSFLGSLFILGKISEAATNVTGEAASWKTGISSSSPGIILAFFGTVLIAISLIIQSGIEVLDTPVYLNTLSRRAGAAVANPTPSDQKPPIDTKALENIGDLPKKDVPHAKSK